MNRRTAIKQFLILAGGMYLLSSCHQEGATIALSNVKFSKEEEDFMGDLAEQLIPTTDSPGGKTLNLHLFVMKMVDDCASPEFQKKFMKGLSAFQKSVDVTDKAAIMSHIKQLDPKTDEAAFYTLFKSRALQGYLNSEYVMTKKIIYTLVPGKYDGAVKIKA